MCVYIYGTDAFFLSLVRSVCLSLFLSVCTVGYTLCAKCFSGISIGARAHAAFGD